MGLEIIMTSMIIIGFIIIILVVVVILFVYRGTIDLAFSNGGLESTDYLAGEPQVTEGVEWFDDWYTIQFIDEKTVSIGEPLFKQLNYHYLITGEAFAILFDTGPGIRDITPIVKSLTSLPIITVPSHLHWDHVGNINRFERVALLDLLNLRESVSNGFFQPTPEQHLGKSKKTPRPKFHVTEWWKPGETVELGKRKLQVIHAPGHAPESIMLFDPDRNQLFTGDFITMGDLLAYLPGSSLKDYLDTTCKLLSMTNEKTLLLTAHDVAREGDSAPLLAYQDLTDLRDTLQGIKNVTLFGHGLYPRRYIINQKLAILTDFPWLTKWN